jgi:hypothetical protein
MLLKNLIAIIFLLLRIGDLMKDTMELYKDLTSLKLCKSMEKSKFKYGEEALIFLLQNLRIMMLDILKTIRDTKTYHLNYSLKLR